MEDEWPNETVNDQGVIYVKRVTEGAMRVESLLYRPGRFFWGYNRELRAYG